MTCSEINFLSSQAQYGLQIAKQAELPSLYAPDEEWEKAFDRIVFLAHRLAVKQIAHSEKEESKRVPRSSFSVDAEAPGHVVGATSDE